MRILFICGCLEPGKDGVGDYCRMIGDGLIQLGCEVMLLSIYDQFLLASTENTGNKEFSKLIIERISAKYSREKRFLLTQSYITEFKPIWISLQYVPFSYHKKGMDFLLPLFFLKLKKSYNWHLMVHEPWVSNKTLFSKVNIMSLIQKFLLKNLVRKLSPILIHTSNPYYQEILLRGGVPSKLLHLPGNIPVLQVKPDLMKMEFEKLGIPQESHNTWLILGIFGRIRTNVSYISLLEDLLKTPEAADKMIAFFSIGNSGPLAEKIFAEIKEVFKERVLVHKFGHRDIAEISAFFKCLDFGIASVPCHLLGKSGAYAAMRNHGLKILLPVSKDMRHQNEKVVNKSKYVFKIKDECFSSEKVAQALLLVLTNNTTKTVI